MTDAWDRQQNEDGAPEPMLWFRRFEAFRLGGPRRSVLGAFNAEKVAKGFSKTTHVSGSWRRASEQWRWRERAEDWDAQVIEDDRAEWERRKAEWRAREWDIASDLIEKAAQMLRFPVARTISKDGQTVIEPLDWKPSDAATFAKTASALARLSAGEPTEHRRITVDNVLDALPAEFRDAVRKALADACAPRTRGVGV